MTIETETFRQKDSSIVQLRSPKPLRLDYVSLGIDVLTELAEKRGVTYQYIVDKSKKGEKKHSRFLRTGIKQEFLRINDDLLKLTRPKIAAVFKRGLQSTSATRRTDYQVQLKRHAALGSA